MEKIAITEAKELRARDRIEDLMVMAERILSVIRAVSAITMLLHLAKGISAVTAAITEAMADREITSESRDRAKALWQKLPLKRLKSTETKKNVVSVRKKINVPKRTSCTKRKMHR